MLLSIISPIYKGEKMLEELVSRIEASVETFTKDYEIILVNDCSPDNSWTKIKEICSRDKKVKGIPVVSVFVDGILQASNTYSVSLADDGRTAKIAFNGTRSGRIDVILGLNSNVQTYLS